jgi:hypothetical protein
MQLLQHRDGYTITLGNAALATFTLPRLAGQAPHVTLSQEDNGWQRVRLTWQIDHPVEQDELAAAFDLAFTPDLWWAPHLAPEPGDCIAQHVFRSPALIACQGARTLVIVPDLDICGQHPGAPWFMDVDAPARRWWIGLGNTRVERHVEYRKVAGMTLAPGAVELGFLITAYDDDAQPLNPWSRVTRFLWERYARPLLAAGQPLTVPLDRYVEHVYHWAFDTWEDAVWQEFDLAGQRVGAPAFIVNVTQSPNYPGPANLREYLSIWNQAWFSSLRGASGVYRYARRAGRPDLLQRAELTKAFALAAPVRDGIFPAVYRTRMTTVEVDGKPYSRSAGWDSGYWTNSDRTPRERGVTDAWYHVLDASWTALLMLRWHAELEPDARLLDYARTYAEKLLSLQDARGFFPAWLHPETLEPSDVLRDSPETSMSVLFLLKLADVTGDARYRAAALRAMDAVLAEIVPAGRWEDFETYWSCCSFGKEEYLGRRVPRNGMFKQCNLSMFWTAEALLRCHLASGDASYLGWGRRVLDELSMTQQVWQPPFIYIPALGGFGVMNFDGEWNDQRECLFAELFMDYYRATGDAHLFERGVAALKAAFVMMYCPENPQPKALWEKTWPFFGPQDYGFTMENYGHNGRVSSEGEGIGEFTIYDWGNGAAAEARNRIHDHYGDCYIDRARGQAFGIDSIAVTLEAGRYTLTDLAGAGERDARVVFEDGSSQVVRLRGTHAANLHTPNG